jgi:hypothetical protein
MDISDWDISSTIKKNCTQVFNDKSIIKCEKLNSNVKIIESEKIEEKEEKIFIPENVFNFDESNINNEEDLLELVYNLKELSNYLKDNVKNKGFKITDTNKYSIEEFNTIIKYLIRVNELCKIATKYFMPSGKSQSYQNINIVPFKTSSYKPCSQKNLCYVHKYDMKRKCEKNHFVFDTVINDISYLIDSLQIIGLDNFNWIINDQSIIMKYDENANITSLNDYNFTIEKIIKNDCDENNVNSFIINKRLLWKPFTVISFVLKSMHDEASYFLNSKYKSSQKSSLINF